MKVRRPRIRKTVSGIAKIEFSTTFCKIKNPNFGSNIRVQEGSTRKVAEKPTASTLWEQFQAMAALELVINK